MLFCLKAVDLDRNGQISASELQRALVNGNWAPFNAETCRLMVGMFDLNRFALAAVQPTCSCSDEFV